MEVQSVRMEISSCLQWHHLAISPAMSNKQMALAKYYGMLVQKQPIYKKDQLDLTLLKLGFADVKMNKKLYSSVVISAKI